jgi:hypothetical protein
VVKKWRISIEEAVSKGEQDYDAFASILLPQAVTMTESEKIVLKLINFEQVNIKNVPIPLKKTKEERVHEINFKWIPYLLRWDYQLIDELPGTLRIRNPEGNQELLKCVEVNKGRNTLGINIAPDGNQDGEVNHLLTKVRQWIS